MLCLHVYVQVTERDIESGCFLFICESCKQYASVTFFPGTNGELLLDK